VPNGVRGRVIIVVAAVVVVGTIVIALLAPVGRAQALTSALAILTGVVLGVLALEATREQTEEARRATEVSRHAILVPVHDPVDVPITGSATRHPPTRNEFRLDFPTTARYAFFVNETRSDHGERRTAVLPIRNVGEGPALAVTGRLHAADGFIGELLGAAAVGGGETTVMKAILVLATNGPVPAAFTAWRRSQGDASDDLSDAYCLELRCVDIFGHAWRGLCFYDPRGLGAWELHDGYEMESRTK
jgi:hypothetical protein